MFLFVFFPLYLCNLFLVSSSAARCRYTVNRKPALLLLPLGGISVVLRVCWWRVVRDAFFLFSRESVTMAPHRRHRSSQGGDSGRTRVPRRCWQSRQFDVHRPVQSRTTRVRLLAPSWSSKPYITPNLYYIYTYIAISSVYIIYVYSIILLFCFYFTLPFSSPSSPFSLNIRLLFYIFLIPEMRACVHVPITQSVYSFYIDIYVYLYLFFSLSLSLCTYLFLFFYGSQEYFARYSLKIFRYFLVLIRNG